MPHKKPKTAVVKPGPVPMQGDHVNQAPPVTRPSLANPEFLFVTGGAAHGTPPPYHPNLPPLEEPAGPLSRPSDRPKVTTMGEDIGQMFNDFMNIPIPTPGDVYDEFFKPTPTPLVYDRMRPASHPPKQ